MIDPTISLQVKPVQIEDPLTQMGKGLNLLNMRNQAQMAPIQMQAAQQQLQAGQMENQQRAIDMQDQQTMKQAWMEAGGDMDKVQQIAAQRGVSPKAIVQMQKEILSVKEGYAKLDQTTLENHEKSAAAIGSNAQALLQMPDEQTRAAQWPSVRQQMMEQGHAKPEQIPEQYPGQQWVELHRNAAVSAHQGLEQVLKERQDKRQAELDAASVAEKNAQSGLAQAQTPGAQAKSDIEVTQAKALRDMTRQDWQTRLDATVPDKNSPLYKRTMAAVQQELNRSNLKGADDAIAKAADQLGKTETAVATAKATAPIKIDIQNAAADAAEKNGSLDLMAEQALNGKFSSRNAQLLAKVYGRAAEMAKDRGLSNQQVLMQQNAAKSNQAALTDLSKMNSKTEAFASLAEKNMKLAEDAMSKVSNLGAPFLNTAVRDLQSQFGGNTDVAAFRAALIPAQAELARLLNSPTGNGVLTNEAREEMQKATTAGATPGQLKAAFDVFRQEIANRRESYNAAVKDLQGRTVVGNSMDSGGGKPGNTPAAPATGGAIKEVHDKAEYDALPAGAQYMQNGVVFTKGGKK